MPDDELDVLLAEQAAYYRARAAEYDETAAFDAGSRAELAAALEAFGPGAGSRAGVWHGRVDRGTRQTGHCADGC